MQLVATAANVEPSQSGLVLPESVSVHSIDEHQLLTGAEDWLHGPCIRCSDLRLCTCPR